MEETQYCVSQGAGMSDQAKNTPEKRKYNGQDAPVAVGQSCELQKRNDLQCVFHFDIM
jgi:hypothetical protein